jgi:hypothetical protein
MGSRSPATAAEVAEATGAQKQQFFACSCERIRAARRAFVYFYGASDPPTIDRFRSILKERVMSRLHCAGAAAIIAFGSPPRPGATTPRTARRPAVQYREPLLSAEELGGRRELVRRVPPQVRSPQGCPEARFAAGYCLNKVGKHAAAVELLRLSIRDEGTAWSADAHFYLGRRSRPGGGRQRRCQGTLPAASWPRQRPTARRQPLRESIAGGGRAESRARGGFRR